MANTIIRFIYLIALLAQGLSRISLFIFPQIRQAAANSEKMGNFEAALSNLVIAEKRLNLFRNSSNKQTLLWARSSVRLERQTHNLLTGCSNRPGPTNNS
jgi:hypothetical protein